MSVRPDAPLGTTLSALVAPAHTVILTQECQKGVLGPESLRTDLYEHGRESGILANMGRVVAAGRAAGCGVIHAIAAHRPDLEGSSQNSRLFRSIARNGLLQLIGTPLVEVIDEIPTAASDLSSTRLHGISPVSGTDVDALLRNLGASTVVVVGVSLNLGVTSAALDLVNLGYEVVIPTDAVIGLPPEYGEQVIANTLQLVTTVVTVDDLVESWAGATG